MSTHGVAKGLAAMLVIVVGLAANRADAASYEQALDAAGSDFAATLNRELKPGEGAWIAPFQDEEARVACEPMSSHLTHGFRSALNAYKEKFDLGFVVSAERDPTVTRVAVAGWWSQIGPGRVGLRLVMGDVQGGKMDFLDLGRVEFDAASLPGKASQCLLSFTDVERQITAVSLSKVRDAPASLANTVHKLETGDKVWVAARITSPGKEQWYVVDLPPAEGLPEDLARRRGFVYGIIAPEKEPQRAREPFLPSGTWNGRYFYPKGRRDDPVPFTVELEVDGDRIEGHMSEVATFGDKSSPYLYADISGRVGKDNTVTFRKTYDGTGGVSHSVDYKGRYDPNRQRIGGTWTLKTSSGAFEMSLK